MRYFTKLMVLGMMVALVGNANASLFGTDCSKKGPKGSQAYTDCENLRAQHARDQGKTGKADKHQMKANQSQQMGQQGQMRRY